MIWVCLHINTAFLCVICVETKNPLIFCHRQMAINEMWHFCVHQRSFFQLTIAFCCCYCVAIVLRTHKHNIEYKNDIQTSLLINYFLFQFYDSMLITRKRTYWAKRNRNEMREQLDGEENMRTRIEINEYQMKRSDEFFCSSSSQKKNIYIKFISICCPRRQNLVF